MLNRFSQERESAGSRLLLLFPLCVTFVGIPVVLLTRLIAYEHHPDSFAYSLPSISKTAAFPESAALFAPGMTLVSVSIFITWILVYRINSARLTAIGAPRAWFWTQGLASVIGIIAGVALGALANVSLEDSNPWHMRFSYAFFISQVLAFMVDSAVYLRVRRAVAAEAVSLGEQLRLGTTIRPWLTLAILLDALFFYFMYLNKEGPMFAGQPYTRPLYVSAEYTVAMMCLSYSSTYVFELKRFLRALWLPRVVTES